MTRHERILGQVSDYYSAKLAASGATPAGVDWNSASSQQLRFEQLLKICDRSSFSLNDWGCGYGALLDYLSARGADGSYRGFDVSAPMIAAARAQHPGAVFITDAADLMTADYTVASGIFNVKLDTGEAEWRDYVLATLDSIAAISREAFAFNMLTSYSDREKMRADLYYADPSFFFDYCKRHFSRRVALLHDYPLFEFTMLVRMK